MNKIFYGGALVAVAVAAMTASAYAQPPVTVNCAKGQKIADALNSHPSSAGALTLLVNGTCTEDVTISRFSGTTIQGNPTATLRPVHPTDTTITIGSHVTLIDVTVISGVRAIADGPRGYVSLENSIVKGPGIGVLVWDDSLLDVIGSTIEATGQYGIQSSQGSTIFIHADPGKTTEITGAEFGVFCSSAKLFLSTDGNGEILIQKNRQLGLQDFDCGVQTYNPSGTIRIAANGAKNAYGAGIAQRGGVAILNSVELLNNIGFAAINATLNAGVQLNNVTMTGNVAGISANQAAIVQFVSFDGPSTVKNNGTNVFQCYQGGQIYVDQIVGTITPTPSKAQLGCLHIGGP